MQPNPAPQPDNDNTPRPATFDSHVMAYLPALKKLARKLTNNDDDREELLQDTLAYALSSWRNFRADSSKPKSGIYNWLTLNMRALAQRNRRRAASGSHGALGDWDKPVAANQEDIAYANGIIRTLTRTREGRMLVWRGRGDTLGEIGKRRGISANRVQQLVDKARARLAAREAA